MLKYGINLFRRSLIFSKAYQITKFDDRKNQWSKIKQEQYQSYFHIHSNFITEKANSIIINLGSSQTNLIKISHTIEQFLIKMQQRHNYQDPKSLIYLLVAMEMRETFHIIQYRNLKESIIQLLYRSNWQSCAIDNKALFITIKSINQMNFQQKMAKKHQAAKCFIFQLLFHNFRCVTLKEIKYIIQLMYQETYNTKLNQRSQKIVQLLFDKIHLTILDILSEDLISDQHKFMFQHSLMMKLASIYNFFKTNNSSYIDSFYRFTTQRLIPSLSGNSHNVVLICNEVYRSIPSNLVNSKSQSYKKIMLQWTIKLYQQNKSLSFAIKAVKEAHHFCYTIITHLYDISFQSLPFELKSDGFTELKAIEIKPPILPKFFWELYQLHYKNLNRYPVIYYAIKNSYPQSLLLDKSEKQLQLLVPYVQTEMNLRSYEALKKLKVKFITETFIEGRFIDYYLPEENIILEIDGLRHFSRSQLKSNDSTNFRNLHLLLSGYKLIVINIFQYNIAREIQDLSYLIQLKLDKIRSGAIYVF